MKNTKKCYVCKKSLPLVCFSKNRSRYDGLANRCKQCDKEKKKPYRKQWARDAKNRLLAMTDEIKQQQGCAYCKEKDVVCLDFHHTETNKDASVGNLINQRNSLASIIAEIQKCEVVCSNCHRKLHAGVYPGQCTGN